MFQVSDHVTPRPTRFSTPEYAEILQSLSFLRRDEVTESPPSSATTSCSSPPITRFVEVVEPRVLRSRAPAPPVNYKFVSSSSKEQKPSKNIFRVVTSDKIQKAYKHESVRGTDTKAKMDPANGKPRRNYANLFRTRKSDTNMSEGERLKRLESDELIGKVTPTSVWCLKCKAWVGLDNRRKYYAGLWEKHKNQYHSPGGKQYELAQKIYEETGQWTKLFEPKRQKGNCRNAPKDD